jgi:hypothetical protein
MTEGKHILVDTNDLHEHPMNTDVYGESVLDEDFVESIEQTGLLQPPVVAPNMDWITGQELGGYRIISGHRRIDACRALGIQAITCLYRTYQNEDEEMFDFLSSNRHRAKDHGMMVREALRFLTIKQVSCQVSGDADSEAENGEMEPDPKYADMTQEEIAVKLGMGRDFVKAVRTVFSDEYREGYFAKLPAKLTKAAVKSAIKDWDKLRATVLAGKVTVYAAMKEIREARKEAAGKKAVSAKPKKVPVHVEDDEAARKDDVMQWLCDNYDWDGQDSIRLNGDVVTEFDVPDLISILVDFSSRSCG